MFYPVNRSSSSLFKIPKHHLPLQYTKIIMALEMLRFSQMNDQIAIQEAASDGLKGMDHLIRFLSNETSPNFSSPSSSNNQLDCRELTEFTVAKFKKVVSVLNRTGHARFRRGPVQTPLSDVSPTIVPAPIANVAAKSQPKTMTIDFSKPNFANSSANGKVVEATTTSECFSLSTTGSSSFVSTITGEGSVSNGKLGLSMFSAPAIGGESSVSNGKLGLSMFSAQNTAIGGEGSVSNGKLGSSLFLSPATTIGGEGSVSNGKLGSSLFISPATTIGGEGSVSNGKLASSLFLSQATTVGGDKRVSNEKFGPSMFLTPAPAVSAGKPPLSSSHKKRCHEHVFADNVSVSEECHCAKRRKTKVKKTIKVPAISFKIADIPADDYSWRKYGQKPIKGSPYPRCYYRCSTVKGCPAKKHVERDPEDPTRLIVTYEGEHRHTQSALQGIVAGGAGVVVFESTREH